MGNLLLDASSPAIVWNGSDTTVISGSFTAPAGARLVVAWTGNTGTGDTPSAPTISGGGLSYTLLEHCARPDINTAEAQAAMWTAVSAGAAHTVTVVGAGAATGVAIKVWVFTDDSGATPGIGADKENARATSGTSVTDSVTATATNSRGVICWADWSAQAAATAGTGCTLTGGGSTSQSPTLTYAFALRTTADGVSGNAITMNLNTGTTSHNRWVIAEVTPGVPAVPQLGTPRVDWWPGDGPFMADRFTEPAYSTEATAVVDVSVNAEDTTHGQVTEDATTTSTTTDSTAPALDHQTLNTTVSQSTTDTVAPALDHQTQPAGATSTTTDTVAPATTHQALQPTTSVAQTVTDGTAPALTHQALDATVSTAVILNVNAQDTGAAHQAEGVTATSTTNAQDTGTTHQAHQATVTVAQTATDVVAPALTHQAQAATTSVAQTSLAGETITTHQALNPAVRLDVSAGPSAISHQTFAPDVTQPPGDQNVNAEQTAATHQAFGATWSIAPSDQGVSNTHQAQGVTSTQTTASGTTLANLVAYNATTNTRSAGTAYIGVDTGVSWTRNHDGHAVGSSPDRDTLTVGASLEPGLASSSSADGHSTSGPTIE